MPPRRQERCALSQRARGCTLSRAGPLLPKIGALGSHQTRSGSAVGVRNTESLPVLHALLQGVFRGDTQGARKWRTDRPRATQKAFDGSLEPQSWVVAGYHARGCSRARATLVRTAIPKEGESPREGHLGDKSGEHYRSARAAAHSRVLARCYPRLRLWGAIKRGLVRSWASGTPILSSSSMPFSRVCSGVPPKECESGVQVAHERPRRRLMAP